MGEMHYIWLSVVAEAAVFGFHAPSSISKSSKSVSALEALEPLPEKLAELIFSLGKVNKEPAAVAEPLKAHEELVEGSALGRDEVDVKVSVNVVESDVRPPSRCSLSRGGSLRLLIVVRSRKGVVGARCFK